MDDLETLFKKIESVPDYSGTSIKSVDTKNGYGDTPLHIVSVWGDVEAIKLLLKSKADIQASL